MRLIMKFNELKEKILKDLEEIYKIPRMTGFRYEINTGVDEVTTVKYDVKKIMCADQF